MSGRKRKHSIFAVSNEAVEMIQAEETPINLILAGAYHIDMFLFFK